jgi:hypothetical protein
VRERSGVDQQKKARDAHERTAKNRKSDNNGFINLHDIIVCIRVTGVCTGGK